MSLSLNLLAQTDFNIQKELLLRDESRNVRVKDYGKYLRKSENEIEFVLASMFIGYKSFISSQDGSTCSFHPSCSEYAIQAVQSLGMAKGSLKFFDRYTRCNSLSPAFYEIDKEKKRLIDPVGDF